ncbi:uroporphyrinogen-III synthase [Melghirimyces algeriensis]|uniref:Uroporphyrinogen-III synthase n=1 Tax=Melghirimyces algeriensis TaxID=910412 RepID=A0A521AQS6_9BACL|nr:uroporphyrinogen-III synthase [Melghirimyces algeriensis]SMO37174.1 uroporphyrinogen III methyltransferase / synthase [Melghirimyces algeriensis]
MNGYSPTLYLVGAGPGDPSLLSLKGRDAIRRADVLFYDPKVNRALLKEGSDKADYVPVETGSPNGLQEMLKAVAEEKRVVWCVPGDPFLHSSVVRDAERLARHGVVCEPVPGVPWQLAIPLYSGIPVGSNWMVRQYGEMNEKDWDDLVAASGTRILCLDGHFLPDATRRLLSANASLDLSVAWVKHGSRMEQSVWTGSLGQLSNGAPDPGEGVLILGEVVRSQEHLQWFEKKPLFGRRILITRAKGQSESMVQQVRELGGETVEFPVIDLRPPRQQDQLDQALKQLDRYQWVIFTSVNGVEYFFSHLNRLGIDVRQMYRARLVTIGPKTADALEERGLRVDIQPEEYRAESLIDALKPMVSSGERVLLPRANIARELLAVELERMGCVVTDVDAYDTVPGTEGLQETVEMLQQKRLHILTFTSSSTVRYFVKALQSIEKDWKPLLEGVQVACIGPITANTAKEHGICVNTVARTYTIEGLIEAVKKLP